MPSANANPAAEVNFIFRQLPDDVPSLSATQTNALTVENQFSCVNGIAVVGVLESDQTGESETRDSTVAIWGEIDVMSESSNMLFVTVFGKADALGDLTATNAVTNTFAGAGIAVGFAAATA